MYTCELEISKQVGEMLEEIMTNNIINFISSTMKYSTNVSGYVEAYSDAQKSDDAEIKSNLVKSFINRTAESYVECVIEMVDVLNDLYKDRVWVGESKHQSFVVKTFAAILYRLVQRHRLPLGVWDIHFIEVNPVIEGVIIKDKVDILVTLFNADCNLYLVLCIIKDDKKIYFMHNDGTYYYLSIDDDLVIGDRIRVYKIRSKEHRYLEHNSIMYIDSMLSRDSLHTTGMTPWDYAYMKVS